MEGAEGEGEGGAFVTSSLRHGGSLFGAESYEGKAYDVCLHPNRTLVVGNRPWKVDAYVELSRGKTKRCQPIRITDPAASLATEDGNDTDDEFVAANAFRGAITGYVFKSDDKGLGYYRDSTHADASRSRTPQCPTPKILSQMPLMSMRAQDH